MRINEKEIKERIANDDINWIVRNITSKIDFPLDKESTPLHYASCFLAYKCVKYFIELGYDVNEQDDCTYPLNYLICNSSCMTDELEECIRMLFEYGAKVNIRDKECNETPFLCVENQIDDAEQQSKYLNLLYEMVNTYNLNMENNMY